VNKSLRLGGSIAIAAALVALQSATANADRPARPAKAAAATATATATAACAVRADMPARVSVRYPVQKFAVPLSGCEGRLDFASAQIYKTGDIDDYLFYDTSRVDYWDVYDFSVRPGTYCTIEGTGFTTDAQDISWTQDCSPLRFATSAGLTVARKGSNVTLGLAVWRYDAASSSFIRYSGATVTVQHRVPGSAYWSTLATVRMNSAGRASLLKSAPARRDYRIVVPDTSASFWGGPSPTVTR
jgi:hypothetical protein